MCQNSYQYLYILGVLRLEKWITTIKIKNKSGGEYVPWKIMIGKE